MRRFLERATITTLLAVFVACHPFRGPVIGGTAQQVGGTIAGIVSEVEYQGTYVRVAIAIEGGADISAQLTESQFDAANYTVGERVVATWDPAQASPLKIRSSVTVPSPEKAA